MEIQDSLTTKTAIVITVTVIATDHGIVLRQEHKIFADRGKASKLEKAVQPLQHQTAEVLQGQLQLAQGVENAKLRVVDTVEIQDSRMMMVAIDLIVTVIAMVHGIALRREHKIFVDLDRVKILEAAKQ